MPTPRTSTWLRVLAGAVLAAAVSGCDSGWYAETVTELELVEPAPDAAGAAAPADGAAPAAPAVEQWVLQYYPSYDVDRAPIDTIDWSSMTHIAFGAAVLEDDGTFGLHSYGGAEREANARRLAEAATANGIVPILLVAAAGGGDGFSEAIATDLDRFVAELLAYMDSLGYVGIDFDWEDGEANDAQTLEVLRALRAARPELVLTYPVNTHHPTYHPDYDPTFLPAVAGVVDRIGVMSYGAGTTFIGGGWGSWFSSPLDGEGKVEGASFPISIEQTLSTYVGSGVPVGQLMLGIGGFGLCYPDYVTGPRQPAGSGEISDFRVQELYAPGGLLDTHPEARQWDAEAASVYLALPAGAGAAGVCGQESRFISYEDEESLALKGEWSRANGYGGAIVWAYQGLVLPEGAAGGRTPTALLDAIEAAFLE